MQITQGNDFEYAISSLLTWSGLRLIGYITALLVSSIALLFVLFLVTAPTAKADARIKDIVTFEGIRDNMLVGYGLVVGLNGTGDKVNNIAFTEESLKAFLERLGVNVKSEDLKTKNVAAVTVTASLPPFARAGSRLDVRVSTMGDATNLQGGVLLATTLLGADGMAYAVAQGPIAIEGFSAAGATGTTVLKGVPTNGYISNGGIVEREIPFFFNEMSQIKLGLRNADISTAGKIADAINADMSSSIARVLDPGTVQVTVPKDYKDSLTQLLGKIEQITVATDNVAKVVIDEASGTIVMGENVRIDTVAIAQGNLVVKITETPVISQPGALAPEGAETVQTVVSEINVDENADRKLVVMQKGASLQELVNGLNALGIGPRDMISILQTIKAAGAMQADIIAR